MTQSVVKVGKLLSTLHATIRPGGLKVERQRDTDVHITNKDGVHGIESVEHFADCLVRGLLQLCCLLCHRSIFPKSGEYLHDNWTELTFL